MASRQALAGPTLDLSSLSQATAEATEEVTVNLLVAAEETTGRDDRFVAALPHEALRKVLREYRRLPSV